MPDVVRLSLLSISQSRWTRSVHAAASACLIFLFAQEYRKRFQFVICGLTEEQPMFMFTGVSIKLNWLIKDRSVDERTTLYLK